MENTDHIWTSGLTSLQELGGQFENSLGSVSFKLIGQVDPGDLKDADGLRLLSGLLKGAMDPTFAA